ncbi:unnamed protein product [Effrenium voratum]|uniref:Protein kinase domain-containing protein n=1 Tax=Effrenium voratum TaxID=2562239 RepID=A0AA36HLC5_9DINO|nr:unnamed protein product [Effrenium voratum]CAJ1412986.1 unnamed protein product [Effrenium voratum]CAJ1437892.1 unnamed protein product [Effrenium voratum]
MGCEVTHKECSWGTAGLRICARGVSSLPCLPAICCGERKQEQSQLLELEGASFEALFTLGELIGHGTFGKVYGCQAYGGTDLCVKIVGVSGRHAARAAKLPNDEKLELLRLLRTLHHPNIVRYHQFFQSADAMYIVMSRCLGPDLMDHMEAVGELKMQAVKDISRMMLLAIDAVHRHGLMHRDIKPENFRFKDSDAAVLQLLDFGGAKVAGDVPKAHTVTGTLLYVAPEVFDGVYTKSCDVWSCGIVVFLLVSGHLPFQTSDVTILRSMHRDPVLTGECLFRGERWRQAPATARGLVRGLLSEAATRLTAAAASEHPWLESGDAEAEESDESCVASSGSGSHELKRTYFAWNLAESDASETCSDFQLEEVGKPIVAKA